MAGPIDYDALARQNGAISSQPAGVDYDALAKQHGAVDSTPPAKPVQVPDPQSSWSHFFQNVNPVPAIKAAWDSVAAHPWAQLNPATNAAAVAAPLVKNLIDAHVDQAKKAKEAYDQGNYTEAVGHVLATALPVLGPAAAHIGEVAGGSAPQYDKYGNIVRSGQAPNIPGAAAEAAGLALPMAAGKASSLLPKDVNVPGLTSHNPVTADAMKWAQENGVPVPAGPATGNTYTKVLQRATENTPLGSLVTDSARQNLADTMAAKGRSMAAQVEPTAVVPETAGAAVASKLGSTISALRKEADSAYAKFRAAAEDPKNVVKVQTGTPQDVPSGVVDASGNPIMRTTQPTTDMPMPVDMRGLKLQLDPLYHEMQQWMPISSRNASEGFAAIKGIVEGPDFMPAPIAEKGLSGLKSMAREADNPDLRNVSQGIGANAAGQLQKAIDAAALRAGPDVLDSLRKGRTAFENKMATADVLDKLRDEPVQLFNQATYANDAGINQLRQAADLAPQEMTKIGRAYLEKLLDTATAEGGFDKARTLYNQWSNLGPETKKILFGNPQQVENLDKFFRVGKLLADQPNPSMTAVVSHGLTQGTLVVTNPAVGIPYAIGSAALAKLLYSPKFVKALTMGMKIPVRAPGAALAAGQVLQLAGKDATPISAGQ